jgi:hypothetical protein
MLATEMPARNILGIFALILPLATVDTTQDKADRLKPVVLNLRMENKTLLRDKVSYGTWNDMTRKIMEKIPDWMGGKAWLSVPRRARQ